jgi:hypothetical protein
MIFHRGSLIKLKKNVKRASFNLVSPALTICVWGVPRILYADVVHKHPAAVVWVNIERSRICKSDVLNCDVLAIHQRDQSSTVLAHRQWRVPPVGTASIEDSSTPNRDIRLPLCEYQRPTIGTLRARPACVMARRPTTTVLTVARTANTGVASCRWVHSECIPVIDITAGVE